jgi:hypothetical protein
MRLAIISERLIGRSPWAAWLMLYPSRVINDRFSVIAPSNLRRK